MVNQQPGAGETPTDPEAQQKDKRVRPPALLARLPKPFWHPDVDRQWKSDWPVVRCKDLHDYPALDTDLRVWRDQLESRFRSLDHQAQVLQNQFWRQNLALVVGGLVATTLGVVQAAMGGGVKWVAATQAVLTGLLAGLTVLIRSRRAQQGYLTTRLKAERIKSEFFLFLARAGDYAAGDPVARLHAQVEDIESAEGGT